MSSLENIPAWNQLNDPIANGGADPFASTDCGFECVAMVKYGTDPHRPNWAAGNIREMYRTYDGQGITSGDDLVRVLAKLDVAAHVRNVSAGLAMQEWNRSLADGKPVIILGTWDGSPLHWILVVGSPPGAQWVVNDPWGGVRKDISDAFVYQHYAGQYVHVDVVVV